MRRIHRITMVFLVTSFSCSTKSNFPIEKRYWTPEDYNNVIYEIEYKTPEGEEYPRLSNPETSLIIRKLVDHENYKVILDDTTLGQNHRAEVAEAFFDRYRNLLQLYRVSDKQDMYVYSDEVVEIEKFGLGVQIRYFKLGNDRIKEQSSDDDTKNYTLKRNQDALISNFGLYLDEMNHERYFLATSLPLYADGLTIYFNQLFETFPTGNFRSLLEKARSVDKKVKSTEVKSALKNLIAKLELKYETEEEKPAN